MASAKLPEAFGAVVKSRRVKAGLSQEELAHRAKTNQGYISMLERGERSPSLTTIGLLAKALRTSITALMRAVERELGQRS